MHFRNALGSLRHELSQQRSEELAPRYLIRDWLLHFLTNQSRQGTWHCTEVGFTKFTSGRFASDYSESTGPYFTRKKEFTKYFTSLFTWWGQGFKRLNRILLWRLMLLKGRWKVRTSLLAFSCPAKHNGAKSFMKEHSHFCALAFSRDDFWKIYLLFISMKIKHNSRVSQKWKYEGAFRNYLTPLCLP